MLFSCKGNLNEVRALQNPADAPQGIAKDIMLKYTDSGKVVATLRSEKMLDYQNRNFPYREFPDGLDIEFYDEEDKKSTVTADYGIIYDKSGLIDLRGNVVIFTADSTILEGNQLYWDQNQSWVFTDRANQIKFPDGSFNEGMGFDSNQNFDKFNFRTNNGIQNIDESDK
ncbi:LPS export ABC transporter periplasmic protein LptC [Zunongwangia sp. HRR-M8]|uniref:LPS export ABC transporter periplasmic protein LptC n=1 Tax=Zunongwangia sp. HRR-M8 TaxID=3015170 RepID=UPI0022DDC627|nr:LPS export ABC transporter periplasmic protein LptC [Zunongwangia sp. HRR-M8]WBL21964.1 LPS export ABC transporter periplasmic protein LptC [Zunongwangia sp. HRR-M8]